MAAKTLSFADFKKEVANRLNGEVSNADVNKVLTAFIAEAQDCLVNGYSVSVPGLFKMTPTVKAGRKKGTVVSNPFDGTSKTLRADEPDKFVVKVGKSSVLGKQFPTLRTSAGQELHKALSAKPRKKAGVGK